MTTVSITVLVRGGGDPEMTLNVDPAVVVGSWDDVFLPLLASSLGLGGADDIVSQGAAWRIMTDPSDVYDVKAKLEEAGGTVELSLSQKIPSPAQ